MYIDIIQRQFQQESLFSKAYRPLAQQYFSAGLVWSLPGVLFCLHFLVGGGGGESSSAHHFWGVLFHNHFWGGVLFHHHFWGVLFHYHIQGGGGSSSTITSRGSRVTYPIMLLYTTIECPSASQAKFTWDPPPTRKDWLTDKYDWKHYISLTTLPAVKMD